MDSYGSELPSASIVNPLAYKSLQNNQKKATSNSARLPTIHSMKSMYCSLSVCSILMALMGISYLLFDPIVKYVILNRLVLRNDTDFAELWRNPPITPHFKVYFFNLTNPEEFFNGNAKPHLEEIGPFTYHQKWIKENVRWHDNGTMSYSTRKEFKFIPELSVRHQSKTNITLINVPVISAFYQHRHSDWLTRFAMGQVVSNKVWTTHTVEEFVWGYPEPLFELAQAFMPNPPPLDKFGFFVEKNQSKNLPSYTMYTGEGNPYNLSKISLFNGNDSLGIWDGATCNKVQGSDGATFNPYIQEDETLWFFNDQLCRSMPLVFNKTVKSRDLPGYRFVPRDDVFQMDFDRFPHNECFCKGEELCDMIGDGMFAVTKCQFDAPIILSWPHFLHTNDTFKNAVSGMAPADPEKHGFWFDIQPITGTTLSAKARIQVNIGIQRSPHFHAISKVNDTVVPLLWFEEGLDELGHDLLDVIGQAVTEPPMYKKYILFMLLGVFMTTSCVFSVALMRFCMNLRAERKSTENSAKSQQPQEKFLQILQQQKIEKLDCKNQLSSFKKGHSYNPSQGSGKFLLESEDCSRQHSRNSSTGSTPPTFAVVEINETSNPNAIKSAEEVERLLDPNDQRSD